eukprot:2539427-Pyramimonas_sp.AAC.1
MISRSIARCVWRGDVRLARALLFQHPWTQSLIRVEGESVATAGSIISSKSVRVRAQPVVVHHGQGSSRRASSGAHS